MRASRRTALVAATSVAGSLLGCDAVLGLQNFHEVPCAFDCGAEDAELREAAGEAEAMADAGMDSAAAVDVDAADVVDADAIVPDAGFDETGPTVTQRWARWPMPNPDAAIAPDSSTPLPNPMAYEAGADSGVVRDAVTGLFWERTDAPAMDFAGAQSHCDLSGPGWRVPTRIELVSLIDFTRSPTIDTTTFDAGRAAAYWTSSVVPNDAGPDAQVHWTVSFATGLVDNSGSHADYVRCVREKP